MFQKMLGLYRKSLLPLQNYALILSLKRISFPSFHFIYKQFVYEKNASLNGCPRK